MAPSAITPPADDHDAAGLSDSQLRDWRENGYLIIPDALVQYTVESLLEETHKMLQDFPIQDHPMTKFSTGQDGNDHVGDDYFLTSGDKAGNLTKPKERSINKIGHYLHELSPNFKSVSLSKKNAAIAKSLKYRDPRVLQSMVICKQPEIGGAVPPHQDSTFLYTNPPSAVGFWYALEDATLSNGCLSFANGSHKRTPVKQRFVRSKTGSGTTFDDLTSSQFPAGEEPDGPTGNVDEEYTAGEVKAGALVLIHGNLLHKSEKNLSGKSRFIYTFHMIEGEHDYDGRNWLQPPEQGFSKLYG